MKKFKKDCGGVRLTDVDASSNEIKVQEELLTEAVNMYGTSISYYVHGYSLSAHQDLYAEDVTAHFQTPQEIIVLAEMNQDSLMLSKFGIMNDADLTIIIPIRTFNQTFSSTQAFPEPKSGDLIRLDELGKMRPGGGWNYFYSAEDIINELSGIKQCVSPEEYNEALTDYMSAYEDEMQDWLRTAPIYEITERRDLAPQLNINRLQGVYAWHIKAKKYDYSYEPNAPYEGGRDQVSDETFFGRLTGGHDGIDPEQHPKSPDKKYPQNGQDNADKNFNYDDNGGYDSTYGFY